MTVEAIRLQNFMAFEDTGWIELRPITLLFGRNSSGKSAIIRALRLLKQSLDTPKHEGPFTFESLYGVDLGSFTDMVHGGVEEEHVWFHFRCVSSDIADTLTKLNLPALAVSTDSGSTLQLSLGYAAHRQEHANPDPTRVELVDMEIRLGSDGPSTAPLLFHAALLDPEDADLLGEDWFAQGLLTQEDEANGWKGFACRLDRGFLPDFVPPNHSLSSYNSLKNLVDLLNEDVAAFLRGVIHLGPMRPEPQRRYSFSRETELEWRARGWGAFLDYIGGDLKGIQEEVNDWIQNLDLGEKAEARMVDSPSRITIQYVIGIAETGAAQPLPLSAHGYGLSQVLPIIVQCLVAPAGSVVLIEQPELHLHPRAQAALADLFIEAFQRRAWNEWQARARAARNLNQSVPAPPGPDEIRRTAPRFLLETHSEHVWLRLRRRVAESTRHQDDAVKVSDEPTRLQPGDLQVLFVVRSRTDGKSSPAAICIDMVGDLETNDVPPEFDDFFADDLVEVAALARAAFGD